MPLYKTSNDLFDSSDLYVYAVIHMHLHFVWNAFLPVILSQSIAFFRWLYFAYADIKT